ncbi:MAG: hypothetical protein ACJAT7_002093 [Psychromonas sp.]|jgi:hypothetical protein|uniref:hypothetical protein n=1 Tax=Psychromonas sp. TaxID=1884585 RepID=UPI0039E355A0
MTNKMKALLLDKDELEFLSKLLLHDEGTDSKKLEYNLSSSFEGESLLFQLACDHDLQLVANYGNHHIVFPVQIETGDFANLKMTLKAAEIFEIGSKLRSWRLIPNNKNIHLINEAGEESQFQIKDVSASGISFLMGDFTQADFPAVLDNVFLLLPNRKRLAISGLQISRVDEEVVAYSLSTTDEGVLAALHEYLFECHTQQYE